MSTARSPLLVTTLALIAYSAAPADTVNQIQPLVKSGDTVGEKKVRLSSPFLVGSLNDSGQTIFVADAGGGSQALVQSAGGKLLPVVVPGTAAPGGEWGRDVRILGPVSMNERGNAVFVARVTSRGSSSFGTFLWEPQARRITPVARVGMPVTDGLVIQIAGSPLPVINNRDEIALPAYVTSAGGQVHATVLFRGQDGSMRPMALADQLLPEGGRVGVVREPAVSQAGGVAVLMRRQGDQREYPYLWENGALQALPGGNATALPGRLFLGFDGVWPHNETGDALVAAHFSSLASHTWALYRLAGGKALPVALPGQPMPGGGNLLSVDPDVVSPANAAGEHVFVALLLDGSAAYRVDAKGQVSLLLKTGMTSARGRITGLGRGAGQSLGVSLNNQGQVLLPIRFDRGPDMIALLTPAKP